MSSTPSALTKTCLLNGADVAKVMKDTTVMQSLPASSCDRTVNRRPEVQYRHSWTTRPGGGLDSTCMKCATIIATNMDELSLLVAEQAHICPC
jgi:hypothetical protein